MFCKPHDSRIFGGHRDRTGSVLCITMPPETPSDVILPAKWRNNSSDGDFSKHFRLIHLAGLGVLKHFSPQKNSPLFISISLHFPFHLLSIFSLLFSRSSLLLSLIFSFIFTCLFSPLASSLVFSRLSSYIFSFLPFHLLDSSLLLSSLFLSCLVFSVSLSVSVCLCLCVSLSVSVWCCVLWCCVVSPCVRSKTPPRESSKRLRVYVQNVSAHKVRKGGGEKKEQRWSSSVRLTKICPRRVFTCFSGSQQETFGSYRFKV